MVINMSGLYKQSDGTWRYTTEGCGCCSSDYEGVEISIEHINKYRQELIDQLKIIDQYMSEMIADRLSDTTKKQ